MGVGAMLILVHIEIFSITVELISCCSTHKYAPYFEIKYLKTLCVSEKF
jgi:hypothetical protein